MPRRRLHESSHFVSFECLSERSSCLFPFKASASEMLVRFSFDGIIASITVEEGEPRNAVMALFHVLFQSIIASRHRFLWGKVRPENPNSFWPIGIIRWTEMIRNALVFTSVVFFLAVLLSLKILSKLQQHVGFGCCSVLLHFQETLSWKALEWFLILIFTAAQNAFCCWPLPIGRYWSQASVPKWNGTFVPEHGRAVAGLQFFKN